jgi:molybdopterin-guanine dinucleotide biosynthesis protein A
VSDIIRRTGLIILSGGNSLRFGADKARITFGEASLLENIVSSLSYIGPEIIIVTAPNQPPVKRLNRVKCRYINDVYPGKGPLGGVYSGLRASNYLYNLVVACDMPFLNRELLEYMIAQAPGFDLVIPRVGHFVEPLHAVYARSCLVPLQELLEQGRLSLQELLPRIRARYLEEADLDRLDPGHLSFFNINTRADLDRAQQIVLERNQ